MMQKLCALILGCLLLAGCSGPKLFEDTSLHAGEIQLVEDRQIIKGSYAQMMDGRLINEAAKYNAKGMSQIYAVLGFNHQGTKAKGFDADKRLTALVETLIRNGVEPSQIVAKTIPVNTPEPIVVVAYEILQATGPADCVATPGLDTQVVDKHGYDYKLGCGVKTLQAKQIANPKDLMGVAGLGGENDAERAANVVAAYRTGVVQNFLPGYVISTVAQGN